LSGPTILSVDRHGRLAEFQSMSESLEEKLSTWRMRPKSGTLML
jgi:hypothetical protein